MNDDPEMEIRELGPEDAAAWQSLRLEGLREVPQAFLSSFESEVSRELAVVAARFVENPVFGTFVGGALVGTAGLYRSPYEKAAHSADLWGMYVQPAHQGQGLGEALVKVVLERACATPGLLRVVLSVNTAQGSAQRLYERCGFEAWGVEPAAMVCEDEVLDQVHMVWWVPQEA